MVTGVFYHMITSAIFLMIGWNFSSLKDIFSYDKWIKMSGREKITMICSLTFLTVTVGTLMYLCSQLQKYCENEAK